MNTKYTTMIILSGCLTTLAPAGIPDNSEAFTPQVRRGKLIYLRGESDSGSEVQAILGDPPMMVSAKMLPCVNCHGYEGQGLPEGGLIPSNITWSHLTKSYGVKHGSNRRHRPYDEKAIRKAIITGYDPSGNKIGVGMPRFEMSDEDLSALVAYLKFIEHDRDPGVTDSVIRIATLLPLEGVRGEVGRTIKNILEARFQEINEAGGLYRRALELRVVSWDDTPDLSIAKLSKVLQNEEIFALVAPLLSSGENLLAELAAQYEIPVIAPLGQSTSNPDGENRFLFYLSAGLPAQAQALVDFSVQNHKGNTPLKALLIHRAGEPFTQLASVMKEQCQKQGIKLTTLDPYTQDTFAPEKLARRLAAVDALYFLGPDYECNFVLQQAAKYQYTPPVYLMGAFLGRDVFKSPTEFNHQLFAAVSNSRSARTPQAVDDFQRFLQRHDIDTGRNAASLAAYCAASLLVEALEGSGKALRREKLIRTLEGLYDYETGLTPPLTFGPNRRVGAYGAYMVTIDLEAGRVVGNNHWIEPME